MRVAAAVVVVVPVLVGSYTPLPRTWQVHYTPLANTWQIIYTPLACVTPFSHPRGRCTTPPPPLYTCHDMHMYMYMCMHTWQVHPSGAAAQFRVVRQEDGIIARFFAGQARQPFPSAPRSFSPSVCQSFSPSALQPFSPSALQPLSPSVLRSFSPSAPAVSYWGH